MIFIWSVINYSEIKPVLVPGRFECSGQTLLDFHSSTQECARYTLDTDVSIDYTISTGNPSFIFNQLENLITIEFSFTPLPPLPIDVKVVNITFIRPEARGDLTTLGFPNNGEDLPTEFDGNKIVFL